MIINKDVRARHERNITLVEPHLDFHGREKKQGVRIGKTRGYSVDWPTRLNCTSDGCVQTIMHSEAIRGFSIRTSRRRLCHLLSARRAVHSMMTRPSFQAAHPMAIPPLRRMIRVVTPKEVFKFMSRIRSFVLSLQSVQSEWLSFPNRVNKPIPSQFYPVYFDILPR